MTAQDDLYNQAMLEFAPSLERLARAYEVNAEDRKDLVQEIHIAVWRSFQLFDARCSMRTWVYRVAHNVAVSRSMRKRRFLSGLVSLDDMDTLPHPASEHSADQRPTLDDIWTL